MSSERGSISPGKESYERNIRAGVKLPSTKQSPSNKGKATDMQPYKS